jgi:hypothetical protein
VTRLPGRVASDPATLAAGAAFARQHLAELVARIPANARARLVDELTQDCDPATREAAAEKAETLRGAPGGPRAVAQAIEAMDVCIAQRALHGPALARYFAKK